MNKLIDLVKGLGLNQYESKAYISLLQLKEAPVSLISNKAGIPRARVYDVLVSLEKKGFVVQKPVKPVQYSALPLKIALNSVKEKKKSHLENQFNELNAIVTSLESQIEMDLNTPSSESAVLLTGRKNIYSVIAKELSNNASFTAPKDSIESFEKHFSNKNHSVKLKESNKSKIMFLSDEKALIYLNHPENEEEEKALLIKSNFFVNQLKK